jgi:hypothetical protein
VVGAELMKLDADGNFRPDDVVTRIDAAQSLVGLAERSRTVQLPADPFQLKDSDDVPETDRIAVFSAVLAKLVRLDHDLFRPAEPLTRLEASEAIYRAIGFSW